MSHPAVRSARSADLNALRRLWQQLDEHHARLAPGFFRDSRRAVSPDDLGRMLADVDRRLLVAVLGPRGVHPDHVTGELVGAVDIRVYETPADRMLVCRRRAHVEEIVVDRAHRRQGVGRALMAEATAWCRRRGVSQLLLSVWAGNDDAARFYEGLSYLEVNRVLGRELC